VLDTFRIAGASIEVPRRWVKMRSDFKMIDLALAANACNGLSELTM
jgi:hypothetical protein